ESSDVSLQVGDGADRMDAILPCRYHPPDSISVPNVWIESNVPSNECREHTSRGSASTVSSSRYGSAATSVIAANAPAVRVRSFPLGLARWSVTTPGVDVSTSETRSRTVGNRTTSCTPEKKVASYCTWTAMSPTQRNHDLVAT